MAENSQDIDAQLDECEEIAKRLQSEVLSVTRIWCIVEAFNGHDTYHRQTLRDSINSLRLSKTANVLIKGLTRDTLSSLLRISDPPGKKGERHTFCSLSGFLESRELVLKLEDTARNWQPDWDHQCREQNATVVRENIVFIKSLVPRDWTCHDPIDPRLMQFRQQLRPLRNSILAHAENYEKVQQPTHDEIRHFLKLQAELQAACSVVFLGASDNLQQRWDSYLREANEFWDLLNTSNVATVK